MRASLPSSRHAPHSQPLQQANALQRDVFQRNHQQCGDAGLRTRPLQGKTWLQEEGGAWRWTMHAGSGSGAVPSGCAVQRHAAIRHHRVAHATQARPAQMPERRPQPNGVLDARLGVSNKRAVCETCGQLLSDCTGHFGACPACGASGVGAGCWKWEGNRGEELRRRGQTDVRRACLRRPSVRSACALRARVPAASCNRLHNLPPAPRLHQAGAARVPHRVPEEHGADPAVHLQVVLARAAARGGAPRLPAPVPLAAHGARAARGRVQAGAGPVQAHAVLPALRRGERRGEEGGGHAEDPARRRGAGPGQGRRVRRRPGAGLRAQRPAALVPGPGGGRPEPAARAGAVRRNPRSRPGDAGRHGPARGPAHLRSAGAPGLHPAQRGNGRGRGLQRGRHHHAPGKHRRNKHHAAPGACLSCLVGGWGGGWDGTRWGRRILSAPAPLLPVPSHTSKQPTQRNRTWRPGRRSAT